VDDLASHLTHQNGLGARQHGALRLDDVRDAETLVPRRRQVDVDVAARIDDRGDTR